MGSPPEARLRKAHASAGFVAGGSMVFPAIRFDEFGEEKIQSALFKVLSSERR
jgi:hypothetical protein